jgi:UDP-glucose 4-epimerase
MLGGNGNELRDWTDVRDVVRALDLLSAVSRKETVVVNIGTGMGRSVRQIAVDIINHWGLPYAADVLNFSGLSRTGDPFSLIADWACLARLGFVWEIPVENGMADYVRWFRAQSE